MTHKMPFRWLALALAALALIGGCKSKDQTEDRRSARQGERELREIGRALFGYAQVNDGRYPASLDVLVSEAQLDASQLRPPEGGQYTYVPGLSIPRDRERVLIYEDPSAHQGEGAWVMFGSTEVQWKTAAELNELLRAQGLGGG